MKAHHYQCFLQKRLSRYFLIAPHQGIVGMLKGIDGNNNNIVNDDDLFQKSQF